MFSEKKYITIPPIKTTLPAAPPISDKNDISEYICLVCVTV
jgi:hypothetical protein